MTRHWLAAGAPRRRPAAASPTGRPRRHARLLPGHRRHRLGLWRAAADANGGEIVGYTAVALTWYIAPPRRRTSSLNTRADRGDRRRHRRGAVAVELLRPASVLGVRVAAEVGRALPRLAAHRGRRHRARLLVAGAPPSAAPSLLAAPSLVLAITSNLLAQHAFAAVAFWIRDARSTWFLYQKLVFVLGGMLLPAGGAARLARATVATLLPFVAMAYAPAAWRRATSSPSCCSCSSAGSSCSSAWPRAAFAAGERRLQVVGG